MFCGFGKKNKNSKQNGTSAPQPLLRPAHKAHSVVEGPSNDSANASAPVDLRAEQDEPVDNSVKMMDYLMTQVATKQNETRWVSRLFVLNKDSMSCFYESAPHL